VGSEINGTVLRILLLAQSRTGLVLQPHVETVVNSSDSNPFGFEFKGAKIERPSTSRMWWA